MKKTLLILISGIAISVNVVWAAGAPNGTPNGTRIVTAAGAHPTAVQTGASAVAAHPAAQAKMDAAMAANPAANSIMLDVQKAGGYTPAPVPKD
ncbi:MAG: hypothetical protein ACC657_12235 [Thiohalomonadales bacterium]